MEKTTEKKSFPYGNRGPQPEFLQQKETYDTYDQEEEYDLVVAGAGTSGVICALKACEEGAKVCLVQKEKKASACGHIGAGLVEGNKPEEVEKLLSRLMELNDHRSHRERLELWAKESGEALAYLLEKSKEVDAQVEDLASKPHEAINKELGTHLNFITLLYGPKPYGIRNALVALCDLAEKKGVTIYYETPALRVLMEEDRARGLIVKQGESIMALRAKKGVVLATGDYQNDEAMRNYYLPDLANLKTKKAGRTGDGHKMVVWAGGKIENLNHTKMCHDMDAGPAEMMHMPFLRVKRNGKRFASEELGMELMNCYLLTPEDEGHYHQIFDSAYPEKSKAFAGEAVPKEELEKYIKDAEVEDRTGVIQGLADTQRADSLEELAEKLEIQDKEAFVETVKKYNEYAEKGADPEFGVSPAHLTAIDRPPFYGIHRHLRITMTLGGVEVNGKLQCLRPDGSPIEGLYAAGNLAGNFYGSVDYPLDVIGINLGHNYTDGYYLGKVLSK